MFEHLTAPRWDETFSSWMHRAALGNGGYISLLRRSNHACATEHRGRFADSGYYHDEPPVFSKDFDFEASLMRDVARDVSNLSSDSFKRIFSADQDLVVPWDYRCVYCPDCLENDVREVGYPCWRRSWCYGTSAYCVMHDKLLETMPRGEGIGHDRAWEAFKHWIRGSEVHQGRLGWFSPIGARYRNRLALRVQRWMQSLASKTHVVLPGTQDSVSAPPVKTAAHAIYSILLRQQTRYATGGYAKTLVRARRSALNALDKHLADRLKLGIYESSPYERMCALLLVGNIFGIITPPETARLQHLAKSANSQWPTDVRRIGQMAMTFKNPEEYVLIRSLFLSVDRSIMAHIGAFIEGMEKSTLSMREIRNSHAARINAGIALWERWLISP